MYLREVPIHKATGLQAWLAMCIASANVRIVGAANEGLR